MPDMYSHPEFIKMAGLGFGLAMGVGIMITCLVKWGQRIFNDSEPFKVEEPQANYCVRHGVLENKIDNLQEGQKRTETKVDMIYQILAKKDYDPIR